MNTQKRILRMINVTMSENTPPPASHSDWHKAGIGSKPKKKKVPKPASHSAWAKAGIS